MNVLVVINKTFGGVELEAEIRRRAQEPDSRFHVVVPIDDADEATGSPTGVLGGQANMPAAEVDTTPSSGTEAYEQASARLSVVLARMQELGANITDSHVGPADPEQAVDEAIERAGPYDELLLATPPAGPSAWIDTDLPSKLERRVDMPVTVVEAREQRPRD